MEISKKMYEELVKITNEAKPNEACAYLFQNNEVVVPMKPDSRSVAHFSGIDQQRVYDAIQCYGNPTALFHSHPCVAIPSGTDRMYMATTIPFWGCVWLIMSDQMVLRAWTMREITLIVNEIEVDIYE